MIVLKKEKEGNNEQSLIFMHRMNLMWGSRGNHDLRHDAQLTGSNLVAWTFREAAAHT